MHDHNLASIDQNRHWRKPVTGTGASDTAAIIYTEQAIMRCALDVVLVEIQKLVRHPVEGATRVWAAVQITENVHPLPNNKHIVQQSTQA